MLIERNTTIPTKKREIFSTASDSQPSVEIHVLQGERKMASDNKSIGRFHLDGIPPAPRGVPQIEVTFDIDVNGILHVSAKDLGTSKEQKITITASSGLSEQDIKSMISDAEKHADDDNTRREAAEAKNVAESTVYQTEKFLKEQADKVSTENKAKVEAAIEELKKALKDGQASVLRERVEAVNQAMQAVSADLYAQAKAGQDKAQDHGSQGGGAGPGPGQDEHGPKPGAGKDDGDVIDADFEVVDDDKKR